MKETVEVEEAGTEGATTDDVTGPVDVVVDAEVEGDWTLLIPIPSHRFKELENGGLIEVIGIRGADASTIS